VHYQGAISWPLFLVLYYLAFGLAMKPAALTARMQACAASSQIVSVWPGVGAVLVLSLAEIAAMVTDPGTAAATFQTSLMLTSPPIVFMLASVAILAVATAMVTDMQDVLINTPAARASFCSRLESREVCMAGAIALLAGTCSTAAILHTYV